MNEKLVRLQQLMDKADLNQVELAKRLKRSESLISKYFTGKTPLGRSFLLHIQDVLSWSADWIESGKGDQYILAQGSFALKTEVRAKESKAVYDTGKKYSSERSQLYLSELPEKDSGLYIPYYDVEITAGKIELFFDDIEEIPTGYIYAPQYIDCVACNVKGDSMYDRIFPGSRLYVYQIKNKKYIDFGQIYLVVLDGYRLLKFIDPHPTDDSMIVLRSYNAHYPPWNVEKADILHLFLVKGYENQNAN